MFSRLTSTEFEDFCYRLLKLQGLENVDWRKGTNKNASPSDDGRDIECEYHRYDNILQRTVIEKWFVECKHYKEGVSPDKIQGALSWAQAERPHRLILVASGFFSNPCKDYIQKYKKENKKTAIEKSTPAKVYKCNLYNEIPHAALPLSAIAESSELPENIQNELSDIFQNNNVLMMKQKNDRMLIITENTSNIRHNVEFTELSLVTGQQVKTTLGYNDKRRDSDNEIWEYNKETKKPTHHTVFDENGDMIFTEHWNYDSNEPIKYEMKDAGNKIISLRKETLDGDSQLRVEQLVYDKNGNTRISVSATYDGPDVKRFTYYNADKPQDSGSVFSEYENGLKTKETVYTSDLKVLNTYTSDYDDTTRKDITVWDNQNQEVKKLLSK